MIQTVWTSRSKWIAIVTLNVIMIAAASLIVFIRLRETLVKTTTMAMLMVMMLILGKVPSLVFRNLSLFSQNRLLRYIVGISAVLVFLLIEPII